MKITEQHEKFIDWFREPTLDNMKQNYFSIKWRKTKKIFFKFARSERVRYNILEEIQFEIDQSDAQYLYDKYKPKVDAGRCEKINKNIANSEQEIKERKETLEKLKQTRCNE